MTYEKTKLDPIYCVFGSRRNLLALWCMLILFAKVLRYTVLKVSLVDSSIGHGLLRIINAGSISFSLFKGSFVAERNTAWLFQHLNFLGLTSYTEFEVGITILWNLLLIVMLLKCVEYYNDLRSLFLVVSILALNIWDFNLAKEPVQILFFVGLFFVLISDRLTMKGMWTGCILFLLLAVATFRSYYMLMLLWSVFAGVSYKIIFSEKVTIKRIFVLVFCIAIAYLFLLLLMNQLSPSTYKELLRVRTRTSTATTDIQAVFSSGNLLLFSVNYILTVLRLLFPAELLKFGVKYAIYVGVQLVLSFVYLKALWEFKRLETHERIAFFLFSGFLLMSAVFEPDFGSWIRHEMTAFPLLLVVSGITKRSELEENQRW